MTDITDEQRAAVEWLQRAADPAVWERNRPFLTADRARVILDALPPELTNPQPVLPTEPGLYASASYGADYAWRFDDEDNWWVEGRWVDPKVAATNIPFARLVIERPQVTAEQLEEAYGEATQDTPYSSGIAAILALVNGTDRD